MEIKAKAKNKKKHIIITIICVILALFLVVLGAMPFLVMGPTMNTRYDQEQYNPQDYGVKAEAVELQTQDNITLSAWHVASKKKTKGTVIIVSGITNPSVTAFFGYAKMLSDNGWDSLLVEMRARGTSGGNGIGYGITEWQDVIAGVDYLQNDKKLKELPIVAMGTSMGASTCITAAAEDVQFSSAILSYLEANFT